jgi:hypothetical protein
MLKWLKNYWYCGYVDVRDSIVHTFSGIGIAVLALKLSFWASIGVIAISIILGAAFDSARKTEEYRAHRRSDFVNRLAFPCLIGGVAALLLHIIDLL